MVPSDISSVDDEARRADPDRWLVARFAPAETRERLVALYAFHAEIARVRETVSDPLLGEIRLAWWREAVEEIYAGAPPRRHPVVAALAAALTARSRRPDQDQLLALIDARARDLETERFADIAAVEAYADSTAGALTVLAGDLCSEDALSPANVGALRTGGRAWGLAGLVGALPAHVGQGWITLPAEIAADRVTRAVGERDGEALRACAAPLLDAAERALDEARRELADLAPALWPAFGYLALAGPRLRRVRRGGSDVFDEFGRVRPLGDRLKLVAAAARGRI